MRYLITGTAGFIGFHLARRLLEDGHRVTGFDGMTPYYDIVLKQSRHALLQRYDAFRAHIGQLEDLDALRRAADSARPDVIVHLAAQAGVRYSIDNPRSYTDSNLVGSFNLLELARDLKPRHLLLASTSSAYGANDKMPFVETDKADCPLTFYAATKKAMEAMAHSYSHIFGTPTTCFRFFTVYGPWGRPDMALFKFVDAIENGRPIEVYGEGLMKRDFTYIDDLVEAIVRLVECTPATGRAASAPGVVDTLSPVAPWRVVNIGGGEPVGLLPFIETIEKCLGKRAIRKMLPMQAGDMRATYADPRLLEALTGFRPCTSVEDGVTAFVRWYLEERPSRPTIAA
ncbi:NAD-dependent epimerase/dehydratase family protein [Mesorhizobium sp. B292B1B]|uniref:NAD-dependent epimerase/dehydratase family protein n=1 Tax=unclassified Mesorhizobium TaxID=325217 RepID=UPI00112BAA25|nr:MULTISPECIES: NAD-dependent epimerase/dehydratase family protein [unclassified Mesorhizobium]MCA0014311.1 NAD-dependent epimerase/dehydratase family protein [Mesorhizobium sp. B294B1A1]MCA0036528.1 NAD-dependent epimerase/dehydratase family protein [Mesorhizobium sp. B292B1B]TPM42079.1 NAD-dependent epimerase/dehydratase family protein [Mesorhizobium sp. B2-3-2]